jgi:hypothetical protein
MSAFFSLRCVPVILFVAASAVSAADPAVRAPSAWPPGGQAAKIMISRDNWISAVGSEARGNCGGSGKMKLKGIQEFAVVDADLSGLRGKIVTGALLHFRCTTPVLPARRVSISTVATPWVEGTGGSYDEQQGSACFLSPELGRRDWAFPGSTFLDVAWGKGHTLWRFADAAKPDAAGWQTVAVEPAVVAANAAGLSHGFALMDDVGTEWSVKGGTYTQTLMANRYFNSRHQSKSEPWLEVWTGGEDRKAPEAVKAAAVKTAGLPAGMALVSWQTPVDPEGGRVLGFQVTWSTGGKSAPVPRYLIPMAGKPGADVRMLLQDLGLTPGQVIQLSIAAVDFAGNAGPAFVTDVKVSSQPAGVAIEAGALQPFAASETLPAVGGLRVAVLDLLDKVEARTGRMVPAQAAGYKGGNHIWSAGRKLIRLQAARNEAVAFQVNLEGQAESVALQLAFAGDSALKPVVSRFDYVETGAGMMPDAVLPLTGAVSIPARDDPQAAGQSNATFLGEIYVPRTAAAGLHKGMLAITAGDQKLELAVELTVWDFTLPDKLSFVPEMNCYNTAAPTGGGLAYYRMAHEHRTLINRLYYGWSGKVKDGAAPPQTADGFDFTSFDKDFGPLFDGSAFTDLPRKGEPLDAFYLPFNEDWPVKIKPHYTANYWADEALDSDYRKGFRDAVGAFARHFDQKKWHETIFELYLNNKVYFRKGRTVDTTPAPWIFDEPANTQDFWALRWYGINFHQGADPVRGQAKFWLRADVSRTEYSRNLFWGVLDIEVMGGTSAQKVRQKQDEMSFWGRSHYTEYGGANDPGDPNTQPVVWSLLSWTRGSIGVLPWQTIGSQGCWDKGQSTCLFYPPDKDHPLSPSVRLKAFTRGQQDIEYLTLLGSACDLAPDTVAGGVRQVVNLSGKVHKTSVDDAGTIRFDKADPVSLWALRTRVGAMVSAKAPAYQRVARPMPTPPKNLENLPDIGYVTVAPPVPADGPEM